MILFPKRHWHLFACFISGLVVTIAFSFATPEQKIAHASVQIPSQVAAQSLPLGHPDFYYSHEEPNFYQY